MVVEPFNSKVCVLRFSDSLSYRVDEPEFTQLIYDATQANPARWASIDNIGAFVGEVLTYVRTRSDAARWLHGAGAKVAERR